MESIVKGNPSLTWEGWNVVFLEEDGDANLKKMQPLLTLSGTRKLCLKIVMEFGTSQILY